MLLVRPDRFSQFCCEGTVGTLVVAAVFYFLLRAFRRNCPDGGNGPPDDQSPDDVI